MRILLIGKGGREHALAWKLAKSDLLSKLYLWPGSAAMQPLGEVLPLPEDVPFATLVVEAKQRHIDLVVSGPEAPLSLGLADAFAAAGIPTFGPKQAAAQLESSKAFAKTIMQEAGIPTAAYALAHGEEACREQALSMLRQRGGVVLKASGLAAGKGVFVCATAAEVAAGIERLFHSDMAAAATTVVLEDVLRGRECSYFTFLGAAGAVGLGFAVDFKRLEDGDMGPNTGGMGCYAPVPWLPADAEAQVQALVITPLLRTLAAAGIEYRGCLYVGLMWCPSRGPQVVEFNVRLGDPEAQVLAVYDDRDWLALMAATCGLPVPPAAWAAATAPVPADRRAIAVVMAAASYPYGNGYGNGSDGNGTRPLAGDVAAVLPRPFFAGSAATRVTAFAGSLQAGPDSETLLTGSGRVLTVTARGASFSAAREAAYERVGQIAAIWRGARWRRDIGQRVAREAEA